MLYAMLLGRDWRRGFGPLSNPRTLANGGWFDMGLWRALTVIRIAAMQPTQASALLAPFEGAVTIEMLQRLAAHVPAVQAWQLGPEAFANGFPFDAYVAGAVTP